MRRLATEATLALFVNSSSTPARDTDGAAQLSVYSDEIMES